MTERLLIERVQEKREIEGLSIRRLSALCGVSFSTLARLERGDGECSLETTRRLREWLGDDVSAELTAAQTAKAEALGRAIARGATNEIMQMIREAHTAESAA